jgi:hypothetical protein
VQMRLIAVRFCLRAQTTMPRQPAGCTHKRRRLLYPPQPHANWYVHWYVELSTDLFSLAKTSSYGMMDALLPSADRGPRMNQPRAILPLPLWQGLGGRGEAP